MKHYIAIILLCLLGLFVTSCEDKSPEHIQKMREIHGNCNSKCESLNLTGYLNLGGYCECEKKK